MTLDQEYNEFKKRYPSQIAGEINPTNINDELDYWKNQQKHGNPKAHQMIQFWTNKLSREEL